MLAYKKNAPIPHPVWAQDDDDEHPDDGDLSAYYRSTSIYAISTLSAEKFDDGGLQSFQPHNGHTVTSHDYGSLSDGKDDDGELFGLFLPLQDACHGIARRTMDTLEAGESLGRIKHFGDLWDDFIRRLVGSPYPMTFPQHASEFYGALVWQLC